MNHHRESTQSRVHGGRRYQALKPALRTLLNAVERSMGACLIQPLRHESLSCLHGRLAALLPLEPSREVFELALQLCHRHEFDQTESCLEFIYIALFNPLTAAAASVLRRYHSREDIEVLAVDVVSELFAELTELMLDGERMGASGRLPSPGKAAPWLFQAVKHDAMDHCKSSCNRRVQVVRPGQEESLDEALERVGFGARGREEELAVTRIERLQRQQVFVQAFEVATGLLRERHREVLRLRELENLPIELIATRMGLSPQQTVDLLQYGREKRASHIFAQLRRCPDMAELIAEPSETLALLKRVRLWCVTRSLQQGPAPSLEVGLLGKAPLPPIDARWLEGATDARGHHRL